jgi:hypothetical protein
MEASRLNPIPSQTFPERSTLLKKYWVLVISERSKEWKQLIAEQREMLSLRSAWHLRRFCGRWRN